MTLDEIQRTLQLLSDPVRLRLLHLLFRVDREWEVNQLVEVLNLPQPTVSRHLALLRDSSLVERRSDGNRRLYRLRDEQRRLDRGLLATLETFVAGAPLAMQDLQRAATLSEELTDEAEYESESFHEGAVTEGEAVDDNVFKALSHEKRRVLLDYVAQHPGVTLGELAGSTQISRQSARQHIAILETAELVHVLNRGRQRLHYYNAVPLQIIYDRWTDSLSSELARSMIGVKRAVESDNEN